MRTLQEARSRSTLLRTLEEEGTFSMLASYYDVATGDMTWLKLPPTGGAFLAQVRDQSAEVSSETTTTESETESESHAQTESNTSETSESGDAHGEATATTTARPLRRPRHTPASTAPGPEKGRWSRRRGAPVPARSNSRCRSLVCQRKVSGPPLWSQRCCKSTTRATASTPWSSTHSGSADRWFQCWWGSFQHWHSGSALPISR